MAAKFKVGDKVTIDGWIGIFEIIVERNPLVYECKSDDSSMLYTAHVSELTLVEKPKNVTRKFKVGDEVHIADQPGTFFIVQIYQANDLTPEVYKCESNGWVFHSYEQALTLATAPCLKLEPARSPCICDFRELMMYGCGCGGY